MAFDEVAERAEFEDKIGRAYFIKHVKRTGTGQFPFTYTGLDSLTEVFERDGQSYKDQAIGAMWFAWKIAREKGPCVVDGPCLLKNP